MQNEISCLIKSIPEIGPYKIKHANNNRTATIDVSSSMEIDIDYYENLRLSQSKLKDLKKSPKHFWVKHINPKKKSLENTEAMIFGRAVHKYIFENNDFLKQYAIYPKLDKRLKENKELFIKFTNENIKKEIILNEDYEIIHNISKSIYSKKITNNLLLDQKPKLIEHELYWTDKETNIACKAKLDYFIEPCEKFPNGLIVDLKTTINASSSEFGQSIYKFGYYNQVAFYSEAVKQIYKTENYPTFIFIAVEKTIPYECSFFVADDSILTVGLKENKELMQLYADCMKNDKWYGYKDEIINIGMPEWAMKKFQDNMFNELSF